MKTIFYCMLLASGLCLSDVAEANWTLNIGYHNPIVSTWGLNLLYIGSKFGFEAGVGWVEVDANGDDDQDDQPGDDENEDTAALRIAGDVDLKYFINSGAARAFLQGGVGVGIGANAGDESGAGAGAGTGGGFAGIGLLIGSPSVYAYGSFNISGSEDTFLQAGIGFDI